MILAETNNKERFALDLFRLLAAAIVVTSLIFAGSAAAAGTKQKTFDSPEEAAKAFYDAMKSNDDKKLLAIFGPLAKEVIWTGDPVGNKQRREAFVRAFDLKNRIDRQGDKMVLVVGEKDWPFPIPIEKAGKQWFFDTKAGKDEILNRRIGENELSTIQTMLAIVDAQREYAMKDIHGDGIPEYAQKFFSDPGKKNGLYWETKEGEEPSPLGPAAAQAKREGYTGKKSGDKPSPFHGYYYRMLKAQGKNAAGGGYDYVVKGRMIGGFAAVAYPAKYGSSGVMTFIVNHDGTVYQKDLGRNTAKTAEAMKVYDPGPGWKKVEDRPKQ